MDPAAKQLLQFHSRCLANRLDRLSGFADYDRFLAFALHENGLIDANRSVLLVLPVFGDHRRRIGQLIMQAQIKLFACYFCGKQSRRNIGSLILRIEKRPFRHQARRKNPADREDHRPSSQKP